MVVTSAFNEAIALKKREREREERKRDSRETVPGTETHFPVYGLKTSHLIVQALIQFYMLIVILRASDR